MGMGLFFKRFWQRVIPHFQGPDYPKTLHTHYFRYNQTTASVHAALCDNFDTPRVISTLKELIGHVNKYISLREVLHLLQCNQFCEMCPCELEWGSMESRETGTTGTRPILWYYVSTCLDLEWQVLLQFMHALSQDSI